jgi:aryl-alcohol dehydrogenase-like predicted oxidoreductase
MNVPHVLLPDLGKPLSKIVYGTAHLIDIPKHRQLLDAIYGLGCTTFDTARIYNQGQAEACLGRWIRERHLQSKVIVVTKCGHPSTYSRLNRSELTKDIDASRAALGMESLDLILLHRDDPAIPAGELVECLNEMMDSGKVRAFGVSNWCVKRIAEAQNYAESKGLRRPCVSSSHFSLAPWNREPWQGCVSVAGPFNKYEREWYLETQFPLLAWSSLASGFLSEKVVTVAPACRNSRLVQHAVSVYLSPQNLRRRERSRMLAARKNATVAQIALAYVLNDGMNTLAVVSSSNAGHFGENSRALEICISESERRWLNLESDQIEQ